MPVDASIYNLSRAAPVADPAQQYLTVAKLAQLQREGQVGDLQLAKLQQEMADDEAVKAFYRGVKPGESPRGRLSELMSVSPKAGMAAQKFYQEADKSQADLMKSDRENFIAFADEARKKLPLIRDDASLAQYRDEQIQRAGMFVTPQIRELAMRGAQSVPTRFDPAWVQAQVVKGEELFTPKMERMDVGGSIQMVDMNPFTNPAIRGQSVTKTMTPGEKDTSARGWASNAETRRHNQATEANAGVSFDTGRGVVVNTRTGTASPVMVGGNEFGGGVPLGPQDKDPNDAQGKAILFGSRMLASHGILNDLEGRGVKTGSLIKQGAESLPLVGGVAGMGANFLASKDQQLVEQAQRDFINAVLRRESGAVISEQEFANARRQYFPQPGDDPQTISQKQANRALAVKGMETEAGKFAPAIQRNVAATRPPQQAKDETPVRIRGDDGYNALPKGARYIGPDGIERIK